VLHPVGVLHLFILPESPFTGVFSPSGNLGFIIISTGYIFAAS
jgi:hypothetical protein